jgi:hypothetical protein
MPFQTLMNHMVGYVLSIGLYMGLYYSNTWNARQFPFISPLMFSQKSSSHKYVTYNQTAILNKHYQVDPTLLAKQGLPFLSSSYAFATTIMNVAIMATVSHMCLWHWQDIKSAFMICSGASVKKLIKPQTWDLKFWTHKATKISDEDAEAIDPHYRLMQSYEDVPSWWFASIWVISVAVGLLTSNLGKYMYIPLERSDLTTFTSWFNPSMVGILLGLWNLRCRVDLLRCTHRHVWLHS